MKKYILTCILSAIAQIIFVACQKSESDEPVVVINDKEPQISLNSYSISFEPTLGDSHEIEVTTDSPWRVISSPEWVLVSPMSSNGSGTVIVSVKSENIQSSERTATMVFKATTSKGKEKSVELNLHQKPAKEVEKSLLDIDKKELNFIASGGKSSLKLSGNDQWTAQSAASWCSISPSSGTGNATITTTVSENDSYVSRSTIITIKGVRSASTFAVNVSQFGKDMPTLNVDKTSITFTQASGSSTFGISGSDSWKVSSSSSWCTVSPTSGSGEGSVTVYVTANSSNSPRAGSVTIKGDISGKSYIIDISQDGAKSDNNIDRTDFGKDKELI